VAAQLLTYQISRWELGLPAGVLAANLGLQVASLAAGAAIVNAVFTQADFIEALAQSAVLVARAAPLRLVADHAHKFFGHGGRLSRFRLSGNGPMVDGLAVTKSPSLPPHPAPVRKTLESTSTKKGDISIVVK
jgi:hypothetical protein